MLTGQADQRAIEEAINRSEIFRFIAKPWNDSALLPHRQERVRAVRGARGERTASQEVTRAQNAELQTLNAELGGARASSAPGSCVGGQAGVGAVLRLAWISRWRWCAARTTRCGGRTSPTRGWPRPVQGVSRNPPCHQFLFGRDTPCTGCPMKPPSPDGQGAAGGDHSTREESTCSTSTPWRRRGRRCALPRRDRRADHDRAGSSRRRRWRRWASSPAAWRTRSTTRSAASSPSRS